MLKFLQSWYQRYFTDPEAALLSVLIIVTIITLYFLGTMLAPILTAAVIAYLLEGAVSVMEKRKLPRLLAVNLVFLLFTAFLIFLVVFLLPIISRQASQFFQELPRMINKGQDQIINLSNQYPQIFAEDAIQKLLSSFGGELTSIGQNILSISFASIPVIIIYLILVPLMSFFFLKDKLAIIKWMSRFLPSDRTLITHLWHEMDAQMGNYIRGKVYEIIIVGATAYVVLKLFGLNYAPLLALMVGLSVLIPYIGAASVTVPVACVAYFQWGFGSDFAWIIFTYFVLQSLDGYVLVPILFSDVVNLHAVAIIAAVLIFGGLWGFWGVFFAIPLATLVKAVINSWPTTQKTESV